MRTAMQNLHERWGLGTSKIARTLGISERVARLARDGSESADGAERLDEFLTHVHDCGIEEPASWMSEPIVEGYTVTRWMIYAAGRRDLLLLNARHDLMHLNGRSVMDNEAMLSSFDQDWRRNYWSSFTTFVAEDGDLSTRGKTYDEVRAQV